MSASRAGNLNKRLASTATESLNLRKLKKTKVTSKVMAYSPDNMASFLPPALVELVVKSTTREEFEAKVRWLVAMIFYRVRHLDENFIAEMLGSLSPIAPNVVNVQNYGQFVKTAAVEIEDIMSKTIEELARVYLKSDEGESFIRHLEKVNKTRKGRRVQTVEEMSAFFELSAVELRAIWSPIAFVIDSGHWNIKQKNREVFDTLKTTTYELIIRYIRNLTPAGTVVSAISVAARINDFNATNTPDLAWPNLVPRGERPQNAAQWGSEITVYMIPSDNEAYAELLERLKVNHVDHKEVEIMEGTQGEMGEENTEAVALGLGNVTVEAGNGGGIVTEKNEVPVGVVVGALDRARTVEVEASEEAEQEDAREEADLVVVGSLPMEVHQDGPVVDEGTMAEIKEHAREVASSDREMLAMLETMSASPMAEHVTEEAIHIATLGPLALAEYTKQQLKNTCNMCDQMIVMLTRKIMEVEKEIEEIEAAELRAQEDVLMLQEIKEQRREAAFKLRKAKAGMSGGARAVLDQVRGGDQMRHLQGMGRRGVDALARASPSRVKLEEKHGKFGNLENDGVGRVGHAEGRFGGEMARGGLSRSSSGIGKESGHKWVMARSASGGSAAGAPWGGDKEGEGTVEGEAVQGVQREELDSIHSSKTCEDDNVDDDELAIM